MIGYAMLSGFVLWAWAAENPILATGLVLLGVAACGVAQCVRDAIDEFEELGL